MGPTRKYLQIGQGIRIQGGLRQDRLSEVEMEGPLQMVQMEQAMA